MDTENKKLSLDAQVQQDEAQREQARLLFARACHFVMGAVDLQQLPDPDLPEVAFAGRSNVGKSTLLNAITGRKALARASNTPGRTRELNFFNLDDRLMLVDLPGYGYARTSRATVEKWTRLTRAYLKGRVNLARCFLLIDGRHGIKPNDLEIMTEFDEAAVVYQLVLTKIDKVKQADQQKLLARTQNAIAKRPAAHPQILLVSSLKTTGIADLRAQMLALALAEPRPEPRPGASEQE
ncbi:GTP-binding protein EngB [hydrothermal vent metagenome]|uniref:GTP-binding protein EngB n=1 Tax=hydrothermal vent metagenome TaxID=652676 RepID=A0A3B0SR08_9ZZZZ